MKIKRQSGEKILLSCLIEAGIERVFEMVSSPHQMSLWLANQVSKTSQGFTATIDLPLHSIVLKATILKLNSPQLFEFMWYSEYVMDKTVVTITLQEKNVQSTLIEITEVGPFSQSRWSDPQKIHLDLWKKALNRLQQRLSPA